MGKLKTTNVFLNASFVYIVANGIGQGTTLLANIFFTRYMSQSDYGLYSNYYSYVSLLVPFVGMNLYFGLMNAYIDYKDDIKRLRSSVLMLSMVGLIVTTVAMFAIDMTIGLTMPLVCVFIALLHAYGFFLVNYYIYSMNMENRYYAKGIMLAVPYILQAFLAGIAVFVVNSYVSRAFGATLGILLCGIIAAALLLKDEKPTVNTEYWKYVLRISLPAIIGSVSAMIMQQCDKLMITSMKGEKTTAVYALVYNIGYILYAVQQATNGVWQAWIYKTMGTSNSRKIKDVQKWYLYLMLMMATVLYMVAPEIVKLLSPKSYWHFEYVVPFIVGSYLMLMYSMNMAIIQYSKRTEVISVIVAVAAGINIVLNYLLIPQYGGVGAAYTSVASYFFIFVVSVIYLKIKDEYPLKDKYYLLDLILILALGLIFNQLMDMIMIRYLVFTFFLIAEAVYIYARKSDVKGLFGGRIFEK